MPEILKDPEIPKKWVWSVILITCVVFYFIYLYSFQTKTETSPSPTNNQPINDTEKQDPKDFLAGPPPETREQYIASAKKVGWSEKDPIYYKELLKNPNKFKNIRMKIRGKIMNIEENNNETIIQVYISNDYDSIIVYYPQPIKVYKNDFIYIYGDGVGIIEGNNRMGVDITLPAVRAKYIVKYKG
jgi:hypothetical protein